MSRWKHFLRATVWVGIVSAILITLTLGGMVGAQQNTTYTVEFGDTFEGIARRFDVSLQALLDVNDLNAYDIVFPGTVLAIPQNAPPFGYVAPTEEETSRAFTSARAGARYVIQFGDVLDLIAAYYNVDLDCIIEANAITNAFRVRPGTIVIIPTPCPPYDGMSTIGVARGYEIGRERELRPATTSVAQSPMTVTVPNSGG